MRGSLAAVSAAIALLLVAQPAAGGFVTGLGTHRTAHLFDTANGLEVKVEIPETFSGFAGYTYRFVLWGSNATSVRSYRVAVVVSPGGDTEARWNASGQGPSGAGNTTIDVVLGPDELPFTAPNTPFQVELQAADGSMIDSAQFSVDLRYREPPPDGGLLQLALATGFFWGLVFLYALHLHLAQRKLRARAQALERAIEGSSRGVRADGKER